MVERRTTAASLLLASAVVVTLAVAIGLVGCGTPAAAPAAPVAATAPAARLAGAPPAWNEMRPEMVQALRAQGVPARGAVAFQGCQGCHRQGALGRADGSFPRLAGQHDTVLIKQMTDVRAGLRVNDKMLPFADHDVIDVQDIADIAAYLTRLPVPPNHGKGPGTALAAGEADYKRLCAECHGARGEGDAARFYPRLSGQHYRYLLRESIDIRDGARANANPKMREAERGLGNAQLEAIADYVSRLALQ